MKRALFVFFLSAASLVAECAANAIKNADLTRTDGMGGLVGWSYRNTIDSMVRAKAKPEGVLELTFSGLSRTYFTQHPCELKNGGRYRLSAEVRTSGLKGAKCQLLAWDKGWHVMWLTPAFPDNTHGSWKEVAWSGAMPTRDDPTGYTVAIAGDGGSADGVNVVEIRNFRLEPLDKETAAATKGLPEIHLSELTQRIVPIDPLLAKVCAAKARFTFYWPGEPACGVTACRLIGSIDGGAEKESPLGADGRAVLDFGRVSVGEHRIAVRVVDSDGGAISANGYRFVSNRAVPKGPTGRRLNNFVTELVRQPLEDGTVRFFRPADGWVWMSFGDANRAARGFLDAAAVATVVFREGEGLVEGMRWVTAGWHTLRIADATRGELRVNAVKNLAVAVPPVTDVACDLAGERYRFNYAFWRRFVLSSLNTAKGSRLVTDDDEESLAVYRARGIRIWGGANIRFASPLWLDSVGQWKVLSSGDWAKGFDISVDESAIGAQRLQHVIFAENCWRMIEGRPAQRVNLYWGDATRNVYDDPKSQTSVLAALANSGNGTGVVLPETYAPVMRTPEESDAWIDLFERQTKGLADLVPGAKDMTVFNVSPWIDLGHWSDYPRPEGDSKALWSRMIHAFATRPGFAANSGLASGAPGSCEEELRRFLARLFRYYGLEGGTEDLAAKMGYSWAPGFVKNCDFEEKLAGWTVEPAVGGGIRADSIARYGTKTQGRQKVPNGVGDSFAEFVSASAGPNRLSQRLTGLEPGRLYALMFCAANRANVTELSTEIPPLAFRARLDGAEEIPALRYRHLPRRDSKGREAKPKRYSYVPVYRYVFRAKSGEATLVFEDRNEDGASAPAGTRQILNYVVFRPYYTERAGEEDEIGALIGPPLSDVGNLVPAPKKYVRGAGVFVCRAGSLSEWLAVQREASLPPEGYRVKVAPDGMTVWCADDAGAFYAVKTLEQLATRKPVDYPREAEDKRPLFDWTVPAVEIEDFPAFRWRGTMLDEARRFLGKETVLRHLELMAAHKLNVFHWHLVDDQGWRLEIPGHPELVQYGAVRPQSVKAGVYAQWLGTEQRLSYELTNERYGPFYYTPADVREICEYAKKLHISIVPEIEIPGHERALLAARPDLSCRGEGAIDRVPRIYWSIEKDVLCAGNDETIRYLESVFDAVCELFPDSPVIHIGGDECPKLRWKECPKCQRRKAEIGARDERALQVWFTRHFADYLAKKGRRVIGWDEVLYGDDVPRKVMGMVWRASAKSGAGGDYVSAAEAVRRGHDVVLTPSPFCYFSANPGYDEDPYPYYSRLNGKPPLDLRTAYSFDPFAGIDDVNRSRVIGVQASIWGEQTLNRFDLEWKAWPRTCALAEIAWTGPAARSWPDFLARMEVHRRRLVADKVNCGPLE